MMSRIYVLIFCFSITSFSSIAAENAEALWQNYSENGPVENNIPDFSYTGFFTKSSVYNQAPSTIFDVSMFGANSDDTEDDSKAIQDAIDAASEVGGGIVYLPKGTYRIKGGDREHTLRINSSNIILKGESHNGTSATVLFLENPSSGNEFGLIGKNNNDLRSIATLAIEGELDDSILTTFADTDVLRGERIIPVADTSLLSPHQSIRIQLTDPTIDPANPNKDIGDLVKQLTDPFEFTGRETNTLGRYGDVVEYITKIRRIVDDKHIELYQPLRFDHKKLYSPTIKAVGGLKNVGVENIRFESKWPGGFVHHAPFPADAEGSEIIRSEVEQDYGWTAIWATNIVDSWIKDVAFDNYTQNLIMSNSAFVDVTQLSLGGNGGHAGLTYSSSYSILTRDIHFTGRFVHPLSIRAWTSGCVFTDITLDSYYYNPVDRTGPFIDFHGLYPYENLFEKLDGFYVHSGGDLNVLPHSGIRNTFWNIQAPEVVERFDYAVGEFFNTTVTQANKMYQYFPSSILVGVFGKNGTELKVNRDSLDRVDQFMQIYNFNEQDVPVESLFEAQVEMRKNRYPAPPNPPVLTIE